MTPKEVERLKLVHFESQDFFSDWNRLGFDHMDNDGNITWNKSPVFAPAGLYSSTFFAKVSRKGNGIKREATGANGKTSKRLSKERKDFVQLAEYSVIVTESRKGAGSLIKRFKNQVKLDNVVKLKRE